MCIVDECGSLQLPEFVQFTLRRRSQSNLLLIAPHESDRCLVGYDTAYTSSLYAEQERRRLGADQPDALDARARRIFGRIAAAPWASDGSVTLPVALRRKGGIVDRALFVGTAGMFEIWDPGRALESGDAALCEIATWQLQPDRSPAQEDS